MRKINILLATILVLAIAPKLYSATIYIDPTNNYGSQTGTINQPFSSWDAVSIESGNIYLQKSGTTCYINGDIAFSGKSNITLGTYDGTTRAKIVSAGSGNHIINIGSSSGITVKDLEITTTGDWISAIHINGSSSSGNLIDNCHLHGTEWGVRILTTASGNRIMNSTIHDIGDDGIYVKDASSIVIGYCTIYDINKKYLVNPDQSYSAGDGIQLASVNSMNFHIHNNMIDHSSMGNKFCFIAWGNNYTGIIENNVMIGNAVNQTSAIYLSPTTQTVTVRYNTIKNSNYGIYSYAQHLDAYYNVFAANKTAVHLMPGYTLSARNNVFYNNTNNGVSTTNGSTANLKNNIFNINSGTAKAIKNGGTMQSDNNLFNTEQQGFINDFATLSAWRNSTGNDANSTVGNPQFVDPANQNFHLQGQSPAVNLGSEVGLVRDFFGTDVPLMGSPDAGICEYDGGMVTSTLPDEWMRGAELKKEMMVFPNPSVDGRFAVSFGKVYPTMRLEVFDIQGRLVKNLKYTEQSAATLDMTTQPNGTYIIRLDSGTEMKTLKAVKND